MGNSPAKEGTSNTNNQSESGARPKARYRHKNQMASERKYIEVGRGGVRLNVIKGDLTTEKADVVVCAANKTLALKKGRASGVLVEAGGDTLQEECSAKYSNGINYGEIAVVKGGKLPCKKVYFIALPIWSGNQTDRQNLFDIIKKCYVEADSHGAKSIAIPALGTGFLKYPADIVAQSTLKALEDFSDSNPSCTLKNVSVIVYYMDTSAFQAFQNEVKLHAKGTPSITGTSTTASYNGARSKINKNIVKKKGGLSNGIGINSIMSGKSLVRGDSVGQIKIRICDGKLADQKADVLVNSTTSSLVLENGGLSFSLLERAGLEMQEECAIRYPDGIKEGEIAVTDGYNLRCKKVYHGNLPEWDNDKAYNSKKVLQKFVTNCLEQVENDEFHTIAFPALGTGSLHYPPEDSAQIMIECILQHERNHPETELSNITIVVFDEMEGWRRIKQVYEDSLGELRDKSNASTEAENGFQFKFMESVLKNALERGLESQAQRGSRDWFKIMFKSDPRPPKYWTHFHGNKTLKDWLMESDDLKPMIYEVDRETFNVINRLVQDTWESQFVGQGRDAQGLGNLNYSKVRVLKVERIENCRVFEKYAQKRQELFHKIFKEGTFARLEDIQHSTGEIKTYISPKSGKYLTEDIFPEINEYYMFHGTKESVVQGIIKQGLDPRLSGVNAMFGQGIYCAESSTKADQYADEKSSRTEGKKQMFLTRICLGKMHVCTTPTQFARAPCCICHQDKCGCSDNSDDTFFDSVVGDGHWNFREFVVYDRSQAYPEYIITYKRQ